MLHSGAVYLPFFLCDLWSKAIRLLVTICGLRLAFFFFSVYWPEAFDWLVCYGLRPLILFVYWSEAFVFVFMAVILLAGFCTGSYPYHVLLAGGCVLV